MSAKKTRPKPIRLDLAPMDMQGISNVMDPSKSLESPSSHLAPAMGEINLPKQLKRDLQLKDLDLLQELGSGNGGTVYKVLHRNTNSIMALKVFP